MTRKARPTEPALRAQIYELAARLIPARGTFKSRHLSLYRTNLPKAKFDPPWRYTARIGIAWTVPRAKHERVAFVEVTGNELTTRELALAALVAKLRSGS